MIKHISITIFIFLCLTTLLFLNGNQTKEKRTVIKFSSWGSASETALLKPVLHEFETQNPEIKVEFLHFPQNYFKKLHLLFASKSAPDVIFINNLHLPIYAEFLEDLTDKINCTPFYPKSVEALTYKNKLYAVPRDVSTLVIYYNKDIFDKKFMPYPQKNWTMSDFLEICKKLKDNKTFAISYEEDIFYALPYLMSNGGGILSDDLVKETIENKNSATALEFYNDLRYKYHVAPLKTESATSTMAQMFMNQRIAMHLSGRWLVPKYREIKDFEWDVINFPYGSKGSIVPCDASGWAVSKSSKYKEASIKLIKFLSSEKVISELTKGGLIVPARMTVGRSEGFMTPPPEHSEVFVDTIENSKKTPVNKDYKKLVDKINKRLSDNPTIR